MGKSNKQIVFEAVVKLNEDNFNVTIKHFEESFVDLVVTMLDVRSRDIVEQASRGAIDPIYKKGLDGSDFRIIIWYKGKKIFIETFITEKLHRMSLLVLGILNFLKQRIMNVDYDMSDIEIIRNVDSGEK